MKNLLVYWALILLPVGILAYLTLSNSITSFQFAIGLILYFFYRVITDGLRLSALGLIKRKDIWKLLIPSFRYHYIKSLYFKI